MLSLLQGHCLSFFFVFSKQCLGHLVSGQVICIIEENYMKRREKKSYVCFETLQIWCFYNSPVSWLEFDSHKLCRPMSRRTSRFQQRLHGTVFLDVEYWNCHFWKWPSMWIVQMVTSTELKIWLQTPWNGGQVLWYKSKRRW